MEPTPEQLTSSPAPIPITPPTPTSPLAGLPKGSGFGGNGSFPGSGGSSRSPVMFILIGILGLGALVFGVMTVVFFNQASTATKTLDVQKSAAVDKAKIEQKKADNEANTVANESPFRSYVAPVEFGSFEIKFPKNWSSYIDQEKTGTQVALTINPDFIRRTNSTDELAAAKVTLMERPVDQYMATFASNVKKGTLKQADITISGQRAFDLTGQFSDKRTTREVIVPVRDKVLVFINENSKYSAEFDQILAQSKIVP